MIGVEVNFIATEVIAIMLGVVFRTKLRPCPENHVKRHLYNILFGVIFGFFCFGYQMQHLIFESFLCYVALYVCPRQYVQL